uniref:TRP C-terminal domain-containing protein n=1 Tax=Amphimedon queenslandica TaxID=400682 RepID=A0A1X7VCG7_AMPQE
MELLFGILTTNDESLYLNNRYTANNRFKMSGQPNDTGHLEIGTLYFCNLTVGIDITMSACPPGFVNKNNTCVCSADYDSDHYYGIVRCDNREFEASISSLFWVGYIGNESEDTLFSRLCPQEYCNYNETFHVLPSVPSFSQLDLLICGINNRTGILCSDCIENNSVYYNSPGYKCGNNELCSYGPLFYILSSIIPLTLTFTIIIMLGVNFNSGAWNGFVFFSQIVGYFTATASSVSYVSFSERVFHIISALIYGPFSLRFFYDDILSFCLFKNANFFVIMGIEILSLVFALLLVVTLVSVMKSHYFYRLQTACCKRPFFKPTTLTKALTTFLILCYSQTTQICFKILAIGILTNKGSSVIFPLRVQQMGSQAYLTGVHIPFFIAAIIAIVTIVIFTPLFLIAYPLFYKVFPQKNKVTKNLFRRVEMFKPIFDAFQGCFKDKYRFFSGLYFLYRVIFVSIFSLINVPLASLSMAQVVVMIILAIHLKFQPYKNKLHNNIDGCLFLLMGIINTLTLARFVQSDTYSQDKLMIAIGYTQLVLVFLPIFIIICLLLGLVKKKCCKKLPQMRADLSNLKDDTESSHEANAVPTTYIEMNTQLSVDTADGSKLRKDLEDLEDSL